METWRSEREILANGSQFWGFCAWPCLNNYHLNTKKNGIWCFEKLMWFLQIMQKRAKSKWLSIWHMWPICDTLCPCGWKLMETSLVAVDPAAADGSGIQPFPENHAFKRHATEDRAESAIWVPAGIDGLLMRFSREQAARWAMNSITMIINSIIVLCQLIYICIASGYDQCMVHDNYKQHFQWNYLIAPAVAVVTFGGMCVAGRDYGRSCSHCFLQKMKCELSRNAGKMKSHQVSQPRPQPLLSTSRWNLDVILEVPNMLPYDYSEGARSA